MKTNSIIRIKLALGSGQRFHGDLIGKLSKPDGKIIHIGGEFHSNDVIWKRFIDISKLLLVYLDCRLLNILLIEKLLSCCSHY